MPARRFIPLRIKLLGVVVPALVLPFGLAGSLMYVQHLNGLEQAAAISTSQVVQQVRGSLERLVDDAERLTLAPVSDAEILQLLRDHSAVDGGRILSFEEEAAASRFLTSAVFDRIAISGYTIFTDDGHVLGASVSSLVPQNRWSEVDNAAWMERARTANGSLIVVPSHDVDYYVGGPQRVVSFARLLRDRITHVPIGFAKIDLTQAALTEYLSSPTIGELGRISILTETGEQLYPSSPTPPTLSESARATIVSDDGSLGLTVRAEVSSAPLVQDSQSVVWLSVLIGLLCLAGATVLAAFAIRRVTRPIQHLTSVMGRVRSGDLETRADVLTRDEVGSLTETFNGMMDQIDRLIDQVYRAQISERDALISALQAQMNPHFLYNSLETVNMLAVSHGQWAISEAVADLGRQLRYLTDLSDPLVPLRQELTFAESWVRLQALRSDRQVSIDDRIDPAYDSVLVPRVSVQPLLENALKHGAVDEPLTVTLDARLRGGLLHIAVADSGLGASDEEIRAIRKQLGSVSRTGESTPESGRGVGLVNLAQRLALHFGARSDLRVARVRGGFAVTLVVPLEPEPEPEAEAGGEAEAEQAPKGVRT